MWASKDRTDSPLPLQCRDTSNVCHDANLNRGFVLPPGTRPTLRLGLLHGQGQHDSRRYLKSFTNSHSTQITSQRFLHVRHTESPLLHSFRHARAEYPPKLLLQQVLRSQTAYHRDTQGHEAGHETGVAVFRIECQITAP
ncbi:hypothetical protein T440DRAFT_402948 [Plenodomus tracheiphilus IPT5]|uniref:Uncharacterized protein n=1 Tax=Plenodomus tracheiphilus IPT5 TaxID=1408161 RepID=A0A6A7AY57_9PLEO|nr:hypothetical protein T440DRAFT_402948 [Plenodomus tracheiphilus IPT5]